MISRKGTSEFDPFLEYTLTTNMLTEKPLMFKGF